MIKVDENDPVGELQPSFPYRDVTIKRNVDVKDYYDLESEIGRGKFGTVYRCKEKSTLLTLAAKFVGIARRQDRRNVEREVEIMRTLQHPRLIQLYDAFESNSVMCVIQELIEGGELFERVIDDDFILTEKACTVFMRQICEGVEFIHSQNILHLDLKPENILCLTRTGNRIKIIDFGLARKFEPDKKLQVLFGTPEFVAPEVVNFEQIGFGTDMWSVGVICYVLLSGLSPFMGETDVETMANVTIAQYDFDDEAFDDISVDAKDFISKLLMKNIENRLTANECLSHVWLRRKPPPPPPPQITQQKQNIELIPQPPTNEILDNTKENLREFVDRWTEQGGASPSKIISMPTTQPFKEINDNNVKPHEIFSDINRNLIKDENKNNPENSISRMEIDNVPPIINQQSQAEKLINNINKIDRMISDATQIETGNEIPGKKIKLDDAINSTDNKNVTLPRDNSVSSILKLPSEGTENLISENTVLNSIPSALETIPSNNLPSSKNSNTTQISKLPLDNKLKLNIDSKNQNSNSLPSPTKSQPSVNLSSNDKNFSSVSKSPSDNKRNLNINDKNSNSLPSPTKSQPSVNLPSPNDSNISSVSKLPSDNKINFNNVNKNNCNPTSPTKSQPSSPIGTIPKTPSGSKLKFNTVANEHSSKSKEQPTSNSAIEQPPIEINTGTGTLPKIPSNSKINPRLDNNSKRSELKESLDKLPINVTHSTQNSNILSPKETSTNEHNKNVNPSRSNETVHQPAHVVNVIGSKSNDMIHKPPHVQPHHGSVQKPKLLSQFSVPNDLSKCVLTKNVPASDSTSKQKENNSSVTRTDSKSNINKIDNKELTPTDGKFNKNLNKHVVPPKIHGIVLGQNDNDENNDSPDLSEKNRPKVITHKIFVEGRTDPIMPPNAPSLVNKESKKSDNRIPKPISKSQTSSKLELKETSSGIKNKQIGNRFLDNDRFDRRGSDISCFLHNTENLQGINLADEIKKLSTRLFQMGGNNTTEDQQSNNVISKPIPISSFKNDPIGRFLANHGVVTRRPKYRMSYLNRDVPIGSPPPASNLFYHLSHSNSDTWSDNQTHSAPQSPSASPERESKSLTKDVILRLFDKNNANNNPSLPKDEEKDTAMSSIDSLASYFKTNNETKKKVPPFVTSK